MHRKKWLCGALSALILLGTSPAALADGAAGGPYPGAVTVALSDGGVTVDGQPAPEDAAGPVYTAHDIVYYQAGHDFTYGEGAAGDEHTEQEAAAHTVVHIAQPGTYVLQGSLTRGQIAVDLGEDAPGDPEAVVTLILDGVDVTCTVAPAVIFYNVYECDPDGTAGPEPDLSGAGARVILSDGSENNIAGSYVARIYKSYTLNEDGTAVTDSKKLHKYDSAFYSRMSMTVTGDGQGTGALNITAENEGLDTEMHLAIDGGNIHITSGNDGINCNEDGVSVVTLNGGAVSITVSGETGEGDGVDSNGWLVLNGGSLTAQACSTSADAGIDAENGIFLRGGTVAATGSMLDPITATEACCAVFTFSQAQTGGVRYALLAGEDGDELLSFTPVNRFTTLVLSDPALTEGESYTLLADSSPIAVSVGQSGMMGAGAPQPPDGMEPDDAPQPPDGTGPGDAPQPPDGTDPGNDPQPPDGGETDGEAADRFTLTAGVNYFRAA